MTNKFYRITGKLNINRSVLPTTQEISTRKAKSGGGVTPPPARYAPDYMAGVILRIFITHISEKVRVNYVTERSRPPNSPFYYPPLLSNFVGIALMIYLYY